MENNEIKNSVIISRRPARDNEFLFDRHAPIPNVERVFRYIEMISDLKIEKIPLEELPYGEGMYGYRVHKKDLI